MIDLDSALLNRFCTYAGNLLEYLMMSAFKFLIDTNIVIGLEDNHEVEAELTELTRQCSKYGVRIFVDASVYDDIQRDRDTARGGPKVTL